MFDILVIKPIVVEAISEIITKSDLFSPLQNWAKKRDTLVKKLFSCAYCLSVWISFIVCLFFTEHRYPLILEIFIVHRLSNYWHHLYEFIFWKAFAIKDKYE